MKLNLILIICCSKDFQTKINPISSAHPKPNVTDNEAGVCLSCYSHTSVSPDHTNGVNYVANSHTGLAAIHTSHVGVNVCFVPLFISVMLVSTCVSYRCSYQSCWCHRVFHTDVHERCFTDNGYLADAITERLPGSSWLMTLLLTAPLLMVFLFIALRKWSSG